MVDDILDKIHQNEHYWLIESWGKSMKRIMNNEFVQKTDKKGLLISAWQNQHPIMYWWFAFTSLSFCSVYLMIFSKF